MTKKQARAQKMAWNKAIAEGRVVRWDDGHVYGIHHRSYLTVAEALEAVKGARRLGFNAAIVDPACANLGMALPANIA